MCVSILKFGNGNKKNQTKEMERKTPHGQASGEKPMGMPRGRVHASWVTPSLTQSSLHTRGQTRPLTRPATVRLPSHSLQLIDTWQLQAMQGRPLSRLTVVHACM